MKKNKSVENVELTPSKKKLTQARLPFKLISEDASTPVVPPTRKRKLSADGTDTAKKIGKISKENDLVEDLVVISDEESKEASKPDKEIKQMNPFVKLVDTAWKKKLQKVKPKKRKGKRNSSKKADSVVQNVAGAENDVELMDIDPENQEDSGKTSANSDTNINENDTPSENKASEVFEILVLEDSNDSSDLNKSTKDDAKHELSENKEKDKDSDSESESKTNNISNRKTKSNLMKPDSEIDNPNTSTKSPETPRKEKPTTTENDKDVNNPMAVPVTPKTPARKAKSNAKDKLNTSATSIKLNDSIDSMTPPPSTPKQGSRSSSVTSSLNDSKTDSNTSNLTPKQVSSYTFQFDHHYT